MYGIPMLHVWCPNVACMYSQCFMYGIIIPMLHVWHHSWGVGDRRIPGARCLIILAKLQALSVVMDIISKIRWRAIEKDKQHIPVASTCMFLCTPYTCVHTCTDTQKFILLYHALSCTHSQVCNCSEDEEDSAGQRQPCDEMAKE